MEFIHSMDLSYCKYETATIILWNWQDSKEYLEENEKETNSERLISCWMAQYKIPYTDNKLCYIYPLNMNVISWCDEYLLGFYALFTLTFLSLLVFGFFAFVFWCFVCLFVCLNIVHVTVKKKKIIWGTS